MNEFIGTVAALLLAYAAWCIRVELRISRHGEFAQRLKLDLAELEHRVDRLSEHAQKHGEALASIQATLVGMNATLQNLLLRADRGKE